jgi:hypothetical protein
MRTCTQYAVSQLREQVAYPAMGTSASDYCTLYSHVKRPLWTVSQRCYSLPCVTTSWIDAGFIAAKEVRQPRSKRNVQGLFTLAEETFSHPEGKLNEKLLEENQHVLSEYSRQAYGREHHG